MKLYLAGPMSGKPEFNWPEFKRVTKLLRDKGYEVVCPTESGATHETPYHECLKADMKLLLQADSITFLSDWQKSKGATFEALIAKVLGYKFYRIDYITEIVVPIDLSLLRIIDCFFSVHVGRTLTVVP